MPVACQSDPDLFFSENKDDIAEAKSACSFCRYTVKCLTDAVLNREAFGVFGGTTPAERGTPYVREGNAERLAVQRAAIEARADSDPAMTPYLIAQAMGLSRSTVIHVLRTRAA